MGDDLDSFPEREMKDFHFRQMKKIRVFEPCAVLPRERCSLLALSNRYSLTFAVRDQTLKVFRTKDIIAAGCLSGNPNDIVDCSSILTLTLDTAVHHLALSSDELTLSVCGTSGGVALSLDFYDVRTFFNENAREKRAFASLRPAGASSTRVQDLKWSPVDATRLALCLSDGRMMVLDVQSSVGVVAELPASEGITSVCWSPKGKQVSAGKQDATVVQFTPTLQPKKVIPCPRFYSQDNPVKVLDVLWLSTYSFAVAYAAADGSLETAPQLVVVTLPKKEEKKSECYLNFNDLLYGNCVEREHHYYLCHIEDWDLVLAASAASLEVGVIAKTEDKVSWELWMLEEASRAALPITDNSEDTLPVGVAIDYTSQEEMLLSDEKKLPSSPTLMLLSTDGVLCPFSLLNLNPGVKRLTVSASPLPTDGERVPGLREETPAPKATSAPLSSAFPSFSAFSNTAPPTASLPFTTKSIAPPPASSALPLSISSAGGSFSLPTLSSAATAAQGFSFNLNKPSFGGLTFGTPSVKESNSVPASTPLHQPTASPITNGSNTPAEPATPAVRTNLADRFSAVDAVPAASTIAQAFSFTSTPKPSVPVESTSQTIAVPNLGRPAVTARPVQSSDPPAASTPPAPSAQNVAVKQSQQKKDQDPIMAGIMEEIGHFQKELDDLKIRCRTADFRVGSTDDMRDLRKESENMNLFAQDLKETTESLHCDISTLKTSLLEGFAGAEEARAQSDLSRDKDYQMLLSKKPLDPRREEQLKEIRRLYQYVKFSLEEVNDVLDLEWEKHLEKKRKQRFMNVPGRETLYATLSNHQAIIKHLKLRLDRMTSDMQNLKLYKQPSGLHSRTASTPSDGSVDSELESLRKALLKASLETAPRNPAKITPKMTPAKQTRLRNFLSKRPTPPMRSTAPGNLSRSAFLSPRFFEDMDEVSSSSSLSQPLESEDALPEEEEEEPAAFPVLAPSAPRHPTVVRTPSIQPGFNLQTSSFSRVQNAHSPFSSPTLKVNLDGADSTALATKTVKHGAPPTEKATPTNISAPQAAGRAALSRHMTNQKAGASLTESTLKTVPQVVNVQELMEKDRVPPIPVSTIISSSVTAPVAQVVQQVLATMEANKNSFQGTLKNSTPQTVPASTSAAGFVFAKPDPGTSTSAADTSSKGFSFSTTSAGFGFMSGSPSQETSSTQAKSSSVPGKFSFGPPKMPLGQGESEEPFSFAPKPASPGLGTGSSPPTTPSIPDAPKPQGGTGDTLGSFSGLRVCQSKDAKEAPKTALSFSFAAAAATGSTGFAFGAAPSKSSDPAAASTEAPKALPQGASAFAFSFKPPEEATSSTKPTFSSPATFPPASTSFSSLLQAPLPEITPVPDNPPQLETPLPSESTPAAEEQEPAADPPPKASPADASASEEAEPSTEPPSPPAVPPAVPLAFAASIRSPADAPASSQPPKPEADLQATTPAAAPSSPAAPLSDVPGSIFAPPVSAMNLSPFVSTAASAQASITAPTSVFCKPSAAPTTTTTTTAFGTTSFGANTTTAGFGGSVFGQTPSTVFGQPASSGSASGFLFAQPSGSSGFGQSSGAASTAVSTGGGGLFGSTSTSSASSFSFAASSSTVPFGQNSAPVFGQPSSGFGSAQGSMFGSNTTTSSSSGFGFGQPSVFGGSSGSSGFGQQPSVFGQTQTSGSVFGSNAVNSSGSGFFSGLGGKPSEEAANKNPFGASASAGFGQAVAGSTSNLFGSSGAKSFSFGSSSFAEQKPSGSFSTGAGSVASQGFGSFSTPTKPAGGFGTGPVFGSPPSFGGSPGFGSGPATFSNAPSFSSPLASSSGKVFGEGTAASNVGGFGFAAPASEPTFGTLANQGPAPSFGNLSQQPAGFGAPTGGFSGFGSPGGFGGFGDSNSNQSPSQTFNSWRS